MKNCYLIVLFFFLLVFNISAQDFGEFPDELLKMTQLKEDPEEDAVVIFDKGEIKVTKDFVLEIKRHVRIKVFTEEGKKEANIKLTLWHEDRIDDIEAISISPDGKEYELDSDNIFIEEGERTNKVSFPIPGVEIGSVFDYTYSVRSDYITNLEPWSFQTDIYTKYSEIKVYLPSGFAYQRLSMNLERYNLQEKTEELMDRDDTRKKITAFTWSCSDLPGIKEEPYTDNTSDNYAKMRFVLVSFKNEYVNYKFAKTWDDVAKRIYKLYNDLINDDDNEKLVNSIINTETDALEKAKLLYDYVRTQIRTSEHKALIGDSFKEPEELVKDKYGSSSEKCMLLINLLTNAKLDAKPVWISTRKNGVINVDFCDPSQFNRLICMVKINSKNYFLYPVSARNPFGCLTPATDVGQGLLIEEEKGSIIRITPEPVMSAITIATNASIDSLNTLHANTIIQYTGYAASDEYDIISEKDAKTNVQDLVKKYFADATLDTFFYLNIDSIYKPIILNVSFTLPNFIEESENIGYFSLPSFTSLKTNPFIRPKRIQPIEYDYPMSKTETIKVDLPQNYSISQIPKKRKNLITDLGFNQVYASGNNFVECNRTIGIKSRKLLAKNYSSIRSFYDDVVSASQDQIVINKVELSN